MQKHGSLSQNKPKIKPNPHSPSHPHANQTTTKTPITHGKEQKGQRSLDPIALRNKQFQLHATVAAGKLPRYQTSNAGTVLSVEKSGSGCLTQGGVQVVQMHWLDCSRKGQSSQAQLFSGSGRTEGGIPLDSLLFS